MRCCLSLAALAFGGILGVSSAALEVVTGINATANGWDTRIFGFGCMPNGCVPANVLDVSTEDDSRWSCRPSRSEVDACELTLTLDEPQDIFELRMAMWKGDRRNRTVDVWVDGVLSTTVTTSDSTLEYEAYELSATQASEIVLQGAGSEEDVWLSITGVQLMTESEDEVFPPGPAPTSEDYLGCFNDMITDRVLTTVSSDEAMTLDDCASKCGELANHYYGLQQGNECWCAGCELTERETNTDFDRHGDGTCNTPCTGDSTTTCGGDMSISLFQSSTCLATPAPTPAITTTECSTGATEAALHIVASWDISGRQFDLHVIEPGGVEVDRDDRLRELGEVGMWVGVESGDFNLRTSAYLSLNGLNVAEDAVLGDYQVWGTGFEGTKWSITAHSGGELLWAAGGEFSRDQTETERFVATVSSYAESDCKNNNYDKCPQDTISSDGFPPCTKCPSGVVARGGSTYCTDPALRDLGLPQHVAEAVIADAAGGWAGPGYLFLHDGDSLRDLISIQGEEPGTLTLSGKFERDNGTALAPSAALFLYFLDEESETGFVRGEGTIDSISGNFTATTTGLPIGYRRNILSFALLDPADAGEENDCPADTVFDVDVINEGCSEGLRIKLAFETDNELMLFVAQPNGDRVSSYSHPLTDNGYIKEIIGSPSGSADTALTTSFVEYVLFSGLSGDSMLGEYRVFAETDYNEEPVPWTITATVNGVVEWVEEGELLSMQTDFSSYTGDDDDGAGSSRRNLFASVGNDDDNFFNYTSRYYSYSSSSSSYPRTETFVFNLDSYDPAGC